MRYPTLHKLHKLIKFRSFYLAQHIIAKYVEWFNQEEYREALYAGTPCTEAEVRAWITACIDDPQRKYFYVYSVQSPEGQLGGSASGGLNGELIGHIGLRGINQKLRYAEVGSFFPDRKYRNGTVMEQGLKYIIQEAKKREIKLLTADFVLEETTHLQPFLAVGFTRTPTAPHYLTLQLNRKRPAWT